MSEDSDSDSDYIVKSGEYTETGDRALLGSASWDKHECKCVSGDCAEKHDKLYEEDAWLDAEGEEDRGTWLALAAVGVLLSVSIVLGLIYGVIWLVR